MAVYPTQLAEPVSAPRLGDINGLQPLSTKRAIELQPQIEPGESCRSGEDSQVHKLIQWCPVTVSFLYYDPYQSFAPTYDSSTATLSYAQSVSLRDSRQTAQAWSNQPLPPLPPEEIAGEVRPPLDDTLASIDPSLFPSTSPQDVEKIDPSDMRLYLRMMEESQVIDKRLAENIDLLRALQEAQWSRLRKSETKATDIEIQASKRLLESLTSLANSRPRTPDISPPQHEGSSPYDIGPLLSASIVQSKPKAYYGILEKSNAKGVPDYVMAKEDTDTMMRDGSALMERKNSNHGTKKGKKGSSSSKAKHAAAAQNGTSANISPAIGQADLPQPTATSAHVKQETPIV